MLTAEEIARGPNQEPGPARGRWEVVSGKGDGITPGFTIHDAAGVTCSGVRPAVEPGDGHRRRDGVDQLFGALGYNVPQNDLATVREI